MDRPKKEDFKVEYIKGVAEISSVTKQYSRAQDLYINYLEQLLIQRVSQQRELLIAFAKYMEEDKMYARHDEANADDFLEKYSN
mgnify:CR=1 FL=1